MHRRALSILSFSCALACTTEPTPPTTDDTGSVGSETGAQESGTEGEPTTSTGSSSGGATTMVSSSGLESTTTGISECGNGIIENGEQCDGTELGGTTCAELGFTDGVLTCDGCGFDPSECGPPPGMVLVPGGEFTMGSDSYPAEQPIRTVDVSTFWIDETEVTVGAYRACVDAGGCDEPGTAGACNWELPDRDDHPINCVLWDHASQYCSWVAPGGRLPTEAEWEKAARGTAPAGPTDDVYPWGTSPTASCTHAIMNDGGPSCGMGATTWPVGSRPMGDSPYGAMDMAGNLYEWVADWFGPYDPADVVDPTGPETGAEHVARGGDWGANPPGVRATNRAWPDPSELYNWMGFRCAMTPPTSVGG